MSMTLKEKRERAYKFAAEVGRADMAEHLGVGETAIGNAVSRGEFPASWFLVVSELCEQKGIECPPDIFKMRRLSGAS